MKNLTFLLVALLCAGTISAQKGVKIGLHFTPGASLALNNEDFDKGESLNLSGAFGYDLGLTVGYGFNDKLSLVTGIGFNNHVSAFVHDRAFIKVLGTDQPDPNNKKKFSRTLGYVRVPLYLQIGGSSADEGGGFFFRFGPTFNFLTGARYLDERFAGYSKYDAALLENPAGIDMNKQTDIWTTTDAGTTRTNSGTQGAIYESFVLGIGLDIGGQIKLAENFHMMITLHLETSLTNPEGSGASSYAHNISEDVITGGYVFGVFVPNNTADATKLLSDQTPFDATLPNYTSETYPNLSKRSSTFNVFGGLTFGFQYTIAVD